MRGCFPLIENQIVSAEVLPAYAGMFPCPAVGREHADRSPRVCGDVSQTLWDYFGLPTFSPRMRGCFQLVRQDAPTQAVLPAYAGMFLRFFPLAVKVLRSPRVCGDVSSAKH